MKLIEIKSNFQILLVPNYYTFQIIMIYLIAIIVCQVDNQCKQIQIHFFGLFISTVCSWLTALLFK